MADQTDLKIGIEAQSNPGAAIAMSNAVADLSEAINGIVKSAQAASKATDALEKTLAGVGKSASTAAKSNSELADSTASISKAYSQGAGSAGSYLKSLDDLAKGSAVAAKTAAELSVAQEQVATKGFSMAAKAASEAAAANGVLARSQEAETRAGAAQYTQALKTAAAANIASRTPVRTSTVQPNPLSGASANYSASSGISLGTMSATENTQLLTTKATLDDIATKYAKAGIAASGFGKSESDSTTKAIGTQFALQTVGTTLTSIGTHLFDAGAAAFKTAADFQNAFADVQRTTQTSGAAAATLKSQLIELSTQIPHTFEDIAGVAALGGQLGIASSGIVSFTNVVAKLKLTTDLTYDAAGTAIGRLSTLLHVPSTQFENLASSILKVGVNSVATESQIVKVVNNLASIGSLAKLTAPEIVGFSGALASLGIPAELARGTFTQLFGKMSNAAENGGSQLAIFAQISHKTSAQFAADWSAGGQKATTTLVDFLKGLNSEGDGARNALASLGITSVRYVPTLLKLAQNTGVLSKALSDAKTGYVDNTALASQYATRTNTVNNRIIILNNTFRAFLNNIGSNSLAPLAGVLDLLQGFMSGLADFSGTAIGGTILAVVAGITGLVGALALGGGAVATMAAGLVGLKFIFGQFDLSAFSAAGSAKVMSRAQIDLAVETARTGAAAAAAALGVDDLTISQYANAAASKVEAEAQATNAAAVKTSGLKGFFTGIGSSAKSAAGGLVSFATSTAGVALALGVGLTALSLWSVHMQQLKVNAAEAAVGVGKLTAATKANKQLSSNAIIGGYEADQAALAPAKKAINAGLNPSADQGTKAYGMQQQDVYNAAKTDMNASADTQIASLLKTGDVTGAANAYKALGGVINQDSALFPKYSQAVHAYNAALAVANGTSSTTILTTKQLVTSYNNIEKALTADAKATTDYTSTAAGAANAQIAFYQALSDTATVTAAQKKGAIDAAGGFNLITQTGRDANTAMINLATAGSAYQAQLESQAAPISQVQAQYDKTRAGLIKLATQYGLSGSALNTFLSNFISPPPVDYKGNTSQIDGATKTAKKDVESVPDKKITTLEAEKSQAEKDISNMEASLKKYPQLKNTDIQADISDAKTKLATIETQLGILAPSKSTTINAIDRASGPLETIQRLIGQIPSNVTVGVHVNTSGSIPGVGNQAFASGGLVSGPGNGTSDSVNARLSNGEFVMTASAVQRLGVPYLNSLLNNKTQAKNAPVNVNVASSNNGFVALEPAQFQQLVNAMNVQVMIGQQQVANAANAANLSGAKRGSNG
jgi:TP901 family phage tail tape measure protein